MAVAAMVRASEIRHRPWAASSCRKGRLLSSDVDVINRAASVSAGDRFVRWLGWIATITGVLMFASYLDQIQLNLSGQKGSVIQPLATVVNCGLWTTYGALRRDWPVSFANAPGIVLGALSLITAL
ncbi:SemiSWEET family transporter [Methylorubrum sp. SL192]|uniref:SemiSWEET family transporter n=1 Tax=Methylorubrum sp. SL192 TaxID=2995167 RepID=UPI0022761B8C|nr:SemiSWEET family transporter [Methylorubrum sp. SL192]MCY1641057.1 SemiSWEET family transporter [Methylorubrum sp. SL192]